MFTTKPVLDYYSSKSNFHEIDGGQKIAEITNKINNILGLKVDIKLTSYIKG